MIVTSCSWVVVPHGFYVIILVYTREDNKRWSERQFEGGWEG